MRKTLRDFLPDYLFLFGVAGGSLALDQYTKWLVRTNLEFGAIYRNPAINWLIPYARIVHHKNEGAAFGMFQNGGSIFLVLAIVVGLAITNYFVIVPRADRLLRFALALQMGGALGNMSDRLIVGSVTDFIWIWKFPIFNFADLSITLGAALILVPLVSILRDEWGTRGLMQAARKRNLAYRQTPAPGKSADVDIYSLGLLEHIFYELPVVRKFVLDQKVKELRDRQDKRRAGSRL